MSPLIAWTNFYVIVGSAAGALTGLTFIAITLVSQTRQHQAEIGISSFTTPTIVQFGVVLFIAALLGMPWPTVLPPAIALSVVGIAGILYTYWVMRRQRHLQAYTIVLDDLIWYRVCPLVAYAVLFGAAVLLPYRPHPTLFVLGGTMLFLLYLGLRNAWDLVTFITINHLSPQPNPSEQSEQSENRR